MNAVDDLVWVPTIGLCDMDWLTPQDGSRDGLEMFAWGNRYPDGMAVLLSVDLRKPPGEMQKWRVMPGG